MQINDFDDFEPFNTLRKKMGAEVLGSFELFDPEKKITFSERELLEIGGFDVPSNRLRILKDKTFAFKNTRLWLSWPEHGSYHLAGCDSVQKRRHKKANFIAGLHQPTDKIVCLDCLKSLKFNGLDARRSRRLDLAETIQKEFQLTEFQKDYPFYPLV
ncbi:MAG: hypothetical protein ACJAR6_001360 [Oleispira sp.]|jgi:hypothetical protein